MGRKKTVAEQRHNRQVRKEQRKSLRETAQKYWKEWEQQQETKRKIAEKAKEAFKSGWVDTQKKVATVIELLENYYGEEYQEDQYVSDELADIYNRIYIKNESLPSGLQDLNLTEKEISYINDVMKEKGYERKLVRKEEKSPTDFAQKFLSFFKKDSDDNGNDNGNLISPKHGF